MTAEAKSANVSQTQLQKILIAKEQIADVSQPLLQNRLTAEGKMQTGVNRCHIFNSKQDSISEGERHADKIL
ncbi:MAG: hypothetical protein J5802_04995 [Butyrivibrio sp.]|nr:hypothetical protein [Butyrivibrio sp.]